MDTNFRPASSQNGTFGSVNSGQTAVPALQNLEVYDTKLDYGNVLLVPGTRTPVSSRKDVNLHCRVEFAKHPSIVYDGIPIMAANMDGVGTLEMAKALLKHRIFTCLIKSYTAEELIEFFDADPLRRDFCAITVGLRELDRDTFAQVNEAAGPMKFVCLDVANGHTERFVKFLADFRDAFPHVVIMAGNVVTPEQTLALAQAGADLIKIGIGPEACVKPESRPVLVIRSSQPCWSADRPLVRRVWTSLPTEVARVQEMSPRPLQPEPDLRCWAVCWPAIVRVAVV